MLFFIISYHFFYIYLYVAQKQIFFLEEYHYLTKAARLYGP